MGMDDRNVELQNIPAQAFALVGSGLPKKIGSVGVTD